MAREKTTRRRRVESRQYGFHLPFLFHERSFKFMSRDTILHIKTAERLLQKALHTESNEQNVEHLDHAIQSITFARDKLKKACEKKV